MLNTNNLIYLALGAAAGYAACSYFGKPTTTAAGTSYGMGRRISVPSDFNDDARILGINRVVAKSGRFPVQKLSQESIDYLRQLTFDDGRPVGFDKAKSQIYVGSKNTKAARDLWAAAVSDVSSGLAERPATPLRSSKSRSDYQIWSKPGRPKLSSYDNFVSYTYPKTAGGKRPVNIAD